MCVWWGRVEYFIGGFSFLCKTDVSLIICYCSFKYESYKFPPSSSHSRFLCSPAFVKSHWRPSRVTQLCSVVCFPRTEEQVWHFGTPTPGPNVLFEPVNPALGPCLCRSPAPETGAPAPQGVLTLCTFGVLRLLRRCRALVESASLTVTAWKFEDNDNVSPSIAEYMFLVDNLENTVIKIISILHCHLLPHIYKVGNFL